MASSPLIAIRKALQKLLSEPRTVDEAVERARLLGDQVDLSRYSPAAIARSTAFQPAARRGASENMLSTVPSAGTTLIRPSEWAARTPQLDSMRDANIIEYLKKSMQEERMHDLPALWINERPQGLEAGYEGRHRMEASRQLYGDDPLPVNLVPGERFTQKNHPKFGPYEEVQGPTKLSPLEMVRQQVMFGDRPMKINPVYLREGRVDEMTNLVQQHPIDVVGPDKWFQMIGEWRSLPEEGRPDLMEWARERIR